MKKPVELLEKERNMGFFPSFKFKKHLDMCFVQEEDSEKHQYSEKSKTAGLFYAESEIGPTSLEVPLRLGAPIKDVNEDGEHNRQCTKLCE
jgi:hypothetical protein